MNVHDDGPDESQNDGRLPIHDVRDIDVDQFDLQDKDFDKITDVDISPPYSRELKIMLFFTQSYEVHDVGWRGKEK